MKKIRTAFLLLVAALALAVGPAGCGPSDAEVASDNLSTAAEQFEVDRRVVAFNGITDKYLLVIEGACDIVDEGYQLEVTCKVGEGEGDGSFKKHFLGLSDNVSYFVEQLHPIGVDTTHYRVIFKPESIVSDFDRP